MKRKGSMRPRTLKAARIERKWTETEAARRLGLSQSYLAMLEAGQRKLTPRLSRKFKAVYGLSPTVLPLPEVFEPGVLRTSEAVVEELSVLGYPGFAYVKSSRREKNPAEVLVRALAQENLEPRVVEALPWLLLRFWDMDFKWLAAQAKLNDLQNRLGFVVGLAKTVAERSPVASEERGRALADLEGRLEGSRLAREDTFLKRVNTEVERDWLRQNRSEEARRWNLLTSWLPEHLPYAN